MREVVVVAALVGKIVVGTAEVAHVDIRKARIGKIMVGPAQPAPCAPANRDDD